MMRFRVAFWALGLLAFQSNAEVLLKESFENVTNPAQHWPTFQDSTGSYTVNFQSALAKMTGNYGLEFNTTVAAPSIWQIQFHVITLRAATNGKAVRFQVYAKGNQTIRLTAQDPSDQFSYLDGRDCYLTEQWQKCSLVYFPKKDSTTLAVYTGLQGSYYFDDFVVETFDPDVYLDPKLAEYKIDSVRRGNFSFQVQNGQSVLPNTQVDIKLVRHAFDVGTALSFMDDADEVWYKTQASNLFWKGTIESDFKWPNYEPTPGKYNQKKIEEYTDWAGQYKWALRGHPIVWGTQQEDFRTHWSVTNGCAEFKKSLKNRINRDLVLYKGRITEYDVWNEPIHEPAIFTACGFDLLDSAFIWAHAADPTAKLFVNEYKVLDGIILDDYYDLIAGMLARKVPVHAIGVQGHFGNQSFNWITVQYALNKLATLGLPIQVTEFDIGDIDQFGLTEQQQAEQFGLFTRAVFSHPAVMGLMYWGFWDARHWKPNAGMIRKDKTPKPALDTLTKLWTKRWTTSLSRNTNEQGIVNFRGFYGAYEMTVRGRNGEMLSVDTISFTAQSNTMQVVSNRILPQRKSPLAGALYKRYDLLGRWRDF